jgi:S-adenosylmethionine-dependent methyltransferase
MVSTELKKLVRKYDLLAAKYDETIHSDLGAEIRKRVIFSTLNKFIGRKPNRILDAGGGTGFYSIPFALQGHEVIILDISGNMLDKANESADKHGVSKRVKTVISSMDCLCFPCSYLDVVFCHLAFGYTEPSETLAEFHRVLKKGGILSLTVANKHFYSIKESLKSNFSKAEEMLRTKRFLEAPPGLPKIRTFTKSEIVSLCRDANFDVLRARGIKVVTDYLPNIPKRTSTLKRLEEEMSEIEDLTSMARHVYLLCRKPLH